MRDTFGRFAPESRSHRWRPASQADLTFPECFQMLVHIGKDSCQSEAPQDCHSDNISEKNIFELVKKNICFYTFNPADRPNRRCWLVCFGLKK